MIIWTEQQRAKAEAMRWINRFGPEGTDRRVATKKQIKIAQKLSALNLEKVTVAEVAAIVGHGKWSKMTWCHECEKDTWDMVEVAEAECPGEVSVCLCADCLKYGLTNLAALVGTDFEGITPLEYLEIKAEGEAEIKEVERRIEAAYEAAGEYEPTAEEIRPAVDDDIKKGMVVWYGDILDGGWYWVVVDEAQQGSAPSPKHFKADDGGFYSAQNAWVFRAQKPPEVPPPEDIVIAACHGEPPVFTSQVTKLEATDSYEKSGSVESVHLVHYLDSKGAARVRKISAEDYRRARILMGEMQQVKATGPTNELQEDEIVRACFAEAGVKPQCVDPWEVFNFKNLKIHLDGDFTLAEIRAFCNALERIDAARGRAAAQSRGDASTGAY